MHCWSRKRRQLCLWGCLLVGLSVLSWYTWPITLYYVFIRPINRNIDCHYIDSLPALTEKGKVFQVGKVLVEAPNDNFKRVYVDGLEDRVFLQSETEVVVFSAPDIVLEASAETANISFQEYVEIFTSSGEDISVLNTRRKNNVILDNLILKTMTDPKEVYIVSTPIVNAVYVARHGGGGTWTGTVDVYGGEQTLCRLSITKYSNNIFLRDDVLFMLSRIRYASGSNRGHETR